MARITLRRTLGFFVVALLVVLAAGALPSGPSTAHAANPSAATYQYLIGSGAVCDLVSCPEKSSAPNGDVLSLAGAGTFSTHPGSATGGGTFTHANASGTVLVTGTWTATGLVSFVDFGIASELVDLLPPGSTGGRVVLRVHISPAAGGPGFDALMTVICDLESNPPGQEEVARVVVPGHINFNKHVSGGNIFIKE